MGLLLLGCYGLGEMLRQRAIKPGLLYWGMAGLILFLAGVVSPYGLSYLPFLAHAWTLDRSHIGEWSAMPILAIDSSEDARLLTNGMKITPGLPAEGTVATRLKPNALYMAIHNGRPVGVVQAVSQKLKPVKIFHWE